MELRFNQFYNIYIYNVAHLDIQGDSKRWTQFRTSIFPKLYMVCE